MARTDCVSFDASANNENMERKAYTQSARGGTTMASTSFDSTPHAVLAMTPPTRPRSPAQQWASMAGSSVTTVSTHATASPAPLETVQSGPLTEFHPFSRLPAELRVKIWRMAMREPRLIELATEFKFPMDRGSSHRMGATKVCPRSCQPPAVFHATKESREEALRVYSLRSFGTFGKLVYFNNSVDILFFGKNTNHCSIWIVFYFLDSPVEKVAIDISELPDISCITLMQDMLEYPHSTCTDLKEVIFVAPTKLRGYQQGMIDERWGFLPTMSDAMTEEQADVKQQLLLQIERVQSEGSDAIEGEQRFWVGGNRPSFSFASIRQIPIGMTIHEGVTISPYDRAKADGEQLEVLRQAPRSS